MKRTTLLLILLCSGCTSIFSPNRKLNNLSYGIPSDEDQLVMRPGYILGFRDKDKQAAWVQYRLTKDQLRLKASANVKRSDDFREDTFISTGSALLIDYKGSGYDRGHLAPAADMGYNKQTMSDSFYLSNMSPQRPECNQRTWKDLEDWTREVAASTNETDIFVITGPVLTDDMGWIGVSNKVSVPHNYYKILYSEKNDRMIGFVITNGLSKTNFKNYTCSVHEIEKLTGLNFFSNMNIFKQLYLEYQTPNFDDWSTSR